MREDTRMTKQVTEPQYVQVSPHRAPAPGEESVGPAFTELIEEHRRSTAAMHALYARLSRMWTTYREFTAADTDSSGNVSIELPDLVLGWEAEVERVAVVVQGASHAAVYAVYRNGVNDANLEDVVSGLIGDTPSRLAVPYFPPLRLIGGESIVVRITGAVATQHVMVHVEGRKREL